jgi:hypothetical protein
MLAFGSNAGIELQRTGHSYLHSVVPWIVLLLALIAGGFLRALGRAFTGEQSVQRYACSFLTLWLITAVTLVAIFTVQEFLEGLFLTGHPAGLAGIYGYGGWWAIPAALCIGLVLAAVLHTARWVLREVATRRRKAPSAKPRPAARLLRPADFRILRPAPLVAGWSGRGPPRFS